MHMGHRSDSRNRGDAPFRPLLNFYKKTLLVFIIAIFVSLCLPLIYHNRKATVLKMELFTPK